MTENEAIEILEERYLTMSMCGDIEQCKRNNQAISAAVKALTEIQQYRAIGTVEECREAREKQIAKKPIEKNDDGIECDGGGWLYCPTCGDELTDRIPFDNKDFYFHCLNCGQKFLWECDNG